MKIEIWSDVICPFCYIGKRRLEAAIAQFPEAERLEIEWKSFQLDPDLKVSGHQSPYQYLAERKGFSYEQSVAMHQNVTEMAAGEGLNYDFEHAVVANSFDAHRLLHLAKRYGRGDEVEESLFSAYFTEGKNIADPAVLTAIGLNAGLDEAEIKQVLETDRYAREVHADVHEAQQIGVRGVPFFVFDRKYAISGAQPMEAFLQTLETSFGEWQQQNPGKLNISEGPSCSTDGECE